MILGLITDIHEQVDLLRVALSRLRDEQVDQIVLIGDVFENGERIRETCELLAEAQAIGVWGNHDFGLCVNPQNALREKYGDLVVDYMTSLHPRLEIAGCLFQHVEPWLNAEELMDLWYFDGIPDTPEKIGRIFESAPNRLMFSGHYHSWHLLTPGGMKDWDGAAPITLPASERYFIVIAALCEGRYAVFDTETLELVPFQFG